jgi:hypothetical protein
VRHLPLQLRCALGATHTAKGTAFEALQLQEVIAASEVGCAVESEQLLQVPAT